MAGGLLAGAQIVTARIAGVVVSASDGQPISCALVTLDGVSLLTTDAGEFGFANVAAGEHELAVSAAGHVDQTVAAAAEEIDLLVELVAVVEIAGDGDGPAPVPGPDTGAIAGQVLGEATQEPIAGALVSLDMARVVNSDADGRFAFAAVDAGGHIVSASAAGFAPATWAVTVAAGETVEGVILLEPQPAGVPAGADLGGGGSLLLLLALGAAALVVVSSQ